MHLNHIVTDIEGKKKIGSPSIPTTCAATKTMAFGCVHLVPFTNERHDGRSAIGRSKNLGEGASSNRGAKPVSIRGFTSHLLFVIS